MAYVKPSKLHYFFAQVASAAVSTFIFKRKILRNEIKNQKGPFVVIANHQCALDFTNLIGARRAPMSFVISNSFYNTLPIKDYLKRMGVIPKQQFQTTVRDLKRIKEVIDAGEAVVIYPAGLMCEDGLSTPIPAATYKFLKWLNADVYVARTQGSYFVQPKWTTGFRPGRTTLDIYKLFSKEDLAKADLETIRRKTDDALLFDAYRDQEQLLARYRKNYNIEGLENVLYMCPHCHGEFTISAFDDHTLMCSQCGYTAQSDEYAFLHNPGDFGPHIRYVSDWSRLINDVLREQIRDGLENHLSSEVEIQMIDYPQNRFVSVGRGTISLTREGFALTGLVLDVPVDVFISIGEIPTLPFSPGKYFELQNGTDIYRCLPDDGRLVIKFIKLAKIYHTMDRSSKSRRHKEASPISQ